MDICLCDVTLSVYPLRVTSHKHLDLIHLSTLHQHSKYQYGMDILWI
jgi:hypothetical protein